MRGRIRLMDRPMVRLFVMVMALRARMVTGSVGLMRTLKRNGWSNSNTVEAARDAAGAQLYWI